jgi:hypothetical protein
MECDGGLFPEGERKERHVLILPNQLILELACKVPLALAKLTLQQIETGGYRNIYNSVRNVDNNLLLMLIDTESILSGHYTQIPLGQL